MRGLITPTLLSERFASGLGASHPQLRRPLLVDQHWARFVVSIIAETAPPPLLRLTYQPALNRVPMHVAQLFNAFAPAPYYEVVEAALPDVGGFQGVVPKPSLCRVARSRST